MLREALERLLARHGGLVLVSGEAGIGKTSLVQNLTQEAIEAGALVLCGGCYDLTTTPPYGPWLEITARYVQEDGFPPLPDFVTNARALTMLQSRDALFEGIRAFFDDIAGIMPLVLVLEDLHWSDDASLELLSYLTRYLHDMRILLVATYRDDEITRRHSLFRLMPSLVREANVARIELPRLSESSIVALIANYYQIDDDDLQRLTRHITATSEGNPFFARELLHALEVAGNLRQEDENWRLDEISSDRVPPLVQQVLERRLSLLDDDVRRVLEIAAVIGQDVPLTLWQEVAEVGDDILIRTLEQAITAHLIEEDATQGSIQFGHALIRETLYDELVLLQRRTIHRLVGEALAAHHQPNADTVAHHFQQAGDERAVMWLVRAGYRAERAYAWRVAVQRIETAIQLLTPANPSYPERGWLYYRVGSLLRMSDPARALRYFAAASSVAVEVQDRVLGGCATYAEGLQHVSLGDISRSRQFFLRGIEALESLPESDRRWLSGHDVFQQGILPASHQEWAGVPHSVRGDSQTNELLDHDIGRRGVLAAWLSTVGRYQEALEVIEPYVDWQSTQPLPSPLYLHYRHAYSAIAASFATIGRVDDAERLFHAVWSYRPARNYPIYDLGTASTQLELLEIPYRADQPSRRRQLASLAEGLTELEDTMASGWTVQTMILNFYIVEGRWTDARRWGLASDVRSGRRFFAQRVRGALGDLAYYQGDLLLAREQVDAVLPDGTRSEPGETNLLAALLLQRIACRMALDQGDLDQADAWLDAHRRWRKWADALLGKSSEHLLRAALHAAAGDHRSARTWAETARATATNPRQPLALVAIDRYMGALDLSEHRLDAARQRLDDSLALAEKCEAPFDRALSLVTLAEIHIAAGELDVARGCLANAQAICEQLQATPTLDNIRTIYERLQSSRPANTAGLTAREIDVIRHVAQGLTDAEIAEQLFISRRTVGQHLRSVYNKLGVGSRTAAALFAKDQGFL